MKNAISKFLMGKAGLAFEPHPLNIGNQKIPIRIWMLASDFCNFHTSFMSNRRRFYDLSCKGIIDQRDLLNVPETKALNREMVP